MKANQITKGISVLALSISLNFSTAQSLTEFNLICTSSNNNCYSELPANETPLPMNKTSITNYAALNIDEANACLKLNSSLPSTSYKAILQIIDFNGRVIKTFPLNTMSPNKNEFYINDLLSGDYTCTLTIDEEKKSIGGFTIHE